MLTVEVVGNINAKEQPHMKAIVVSMVTIYYLLEPQLNMKTIDGSHDSHDLVYCRLLPLVNMLNQTCNFIPASAYSTENKNEVFQVLRLKMFVKPSGPLFCTIHSSEILSKYSMLQKIQDNRYDSSQILE